MERRYGALRVIGTIYKVIAVIVAIVTLLIVLGLCASGLLGGAAASGRDPGFNPLGLFGGVFGALIGSAIAILYGGVVSVSLYAAGEFVDLLLALEENTRTTTMLLRGQTNLPAPSSPSPPSTYPR